MEETENEPLSYEQEHCGHKLRKLGMEDRKTLYECTKCGAIVGVEKLSSCKQK